MRKTNKPFYHFDENFLNKLLEDKTSCVEAQEKNYHLALHPYHLNNFVASIKDILNGGVAKYDKNLNGILFGYKNLKLVSNLGAIYDDHCYIHLNIEAVFFIFKPTVGKQLRGVVNKKSKDHVGCLVHKTFNISIPKPESEDNWLGKSVEINSEVLILVTYTNFNAKLPYIKGKIISVLTENKENPPKTNSKVVFDSDGEEEREEEEEENQPTEDVDDVLPQLDNKKTKEKQNQSILEEIRQNISNEEENLNADTKKRKKRKAVDKEDSDTTIESGIKKIKKRKKNNPDEDPELLKLHTEVDLGEEIIPSESFHYEEELNTKDEKKTKKKSSGLKEKTSKKKPISELSETDSIFSSEKEELIAKQLDDTILNMGLKKERKKRSPKDSELSQTSQDEDKMNKSIKKIKKKRSKDLEDSKISETLHSELDITDNKLIMDSEFNDKSIIKKEKSTLKIKQEKHKETQPEEDEIQSDSKAELIAKQLEETITKLHIKSERKKKKKSKVDESLDDSKLEASLHSEVDLDDTKFAVKSWSYESDENAVGNIKKEKRKRNSLSKTESIVKKWEKKPSKSEQLDALTALLHTEEDIGEDDKVGILNSSIKSTGKKIKKEKI